MPEVGEKRADGKVWAGKDYGWQNPQTVWRSIKPKDAVPGKTTKTLPGSLGTKVWTGRDFGWQTQASIDKATKPEAPSPKPEATKEKPSPTPTQTKKPAATTPTPKPKAPQPAIGVTKGGTKFERRTPTSAELRAAQQARAAGKGEEGAIKAAVERGTKLMGGPEGPGKIDTKSVDDTIKAQQERDKKRAEASVKKEAYAVVLDYLLSEGHADTIEEAHYVMMQLDSEYIQDIVEMGDPSFPIKRSTGAGALTPDAAKQLGPKAVELQKQKAGQVALPKLPPA